MKILLVDDKSENLYLLEKMLGGNGYETHSAANGAEALAMALKNPPDLVISDILMPVMDGFTLCREWRKSKILMKIPFVFYTATYTDPKDEEFALSLGADRFIIKPQGPAEFLEIMRNVLHKYEVREVHPKPVHSTEEKVFLKEYNEALVRRLEEKMTRVEAIEKELRIKNTALEKDIEERKRMEEALRESEERYRTLITQSPDGIFLVDMQGNFLSVNKSMCEGLQLSEEEFLSMKIWDIIPEKYVEPFKLRLAKIYAGESINEAMEYEARAKDGKVHFIEVRSAPYFEKNKIIGFQGIAREVTLRKQAEEKIAEQARLLEVAIDTIIVRDIHDRLLFWNKAAEKLYGWTFEEAGSLELSQIICEKDRMKYEKAKEEFFSKGSWEGEINERTKDGGLIVTYSQWTLVRDGHGKPLSTVDHHTGYHRKGCP
jgi:two-component system, cell cycle sensor histidine kinase and response regulator CckA